MPTKILSQVGVSLADTYDVVGSVAGVEELDSESVKVVHEMGGTIFSERLSSTVRRVQTAGILQSANFVATITDFPATPFKIMGIIVMVDVAARVGNAMVAAQDPISTRELPIWAWDTTNTSVMRFTDGTGVANFICLNRDLQYDVTPMLMIGAGAPQSVPNLVMRGTTDAFGAGTVDITLLALIALADVGGGISSRGLPIPSW